jgi:hypothetical protein
MNFENQGVIKRLADQYGPQNLTVILGNGGEWCGSFCETVTEGDPSYAGPLAGVALKIPVYHILEDEVMSQVPESLREEKLQLSALVCVLIRCIRCLKRPRRESNPFKLLKRQTVDLQLPKSGDTFDGLKA